VRKKKIKKVFNTKISNSLQKIVKNSYSGSLVATGPCISTKWQLEAVRLTLTKILKKKNGWWEKEYINHIATTKKSKGARMGKGRGNFYRDIYKVKINEHFYSFYSVYSDLSILLKNIMLRVSVSSYYYNNKKVDTNEVYINTENKKWT